MTLSQRVSELTTRIAAEFVSVRNALSNKVDKITGQSLVPNSEISRLGQMTAIFTTALKLSYDAASNWFSTNGSNVISHLASGNNPHNVTKAQVGLSNVPNTNFTSAVNANTAKAGITTAQASAITANTAKVTNANHTGEVTGSTTLTITNKGVTNPKLADMLKDTIKGRAGSDGQPQDLAVAQIANMLNFSPGNYATAAQGILADAAYPRTGGQINGQVSIGTLINGPWGLLIQSTFPLKATDSANRAVFEVYADTRQIRLLNNTRIVGWQQDLILGTSGNTNAIVVDNSNGNVVFNNLISGTHATLTGTVRFTGNSGFDPNLAGRIYKSSNLGLSLHAVTGTVGDFGLFTPAGIQLITVPTGSNNVSVSPTNAGALLIGTPTNNGSNEKLQVNGEGSLTGAVSSAGFKMAGATGVLLSNGTKDTDLYIKRPILKSNVYDLGSRFQIQVYENPLNDQIPLFQGEHSIILKSSSVSVDVLFYLEDYVRGDILRLVNSTDQEMNFRYWDLNSITADLFVHDYVTQGSTSSMPGKSSWTIQYYEDGEWYRIS